jgi:putative nucleotidyltransferase with HDIG domain
MLGLFLLCALLPTALLAVLAYLQISGQLKTQGREQVRQASREAGMAIIQRLQMAESQLRLLAGELALGHPAVRNGALTSARISRPGEPPQILWGTGDLRPVAPVSSQVRRLASGHPVIVVSQGERPSIQMGIAVDADQPSRGVLWGELDPNQLWGSQFEDGSALRLCILSAGSGQVIACPLSSTAMIAEQTRSSPSGDLTFSENGEEQVLGYWSAFLGFQWGAPSWVVAVAEPTSDLMSSAKEFGRSFVIVMLIALVLVFLASNVQIRRRMEPLVLLQEGTRRLAGGDFTSKVSVGSGDEFESLAESFNGMAGRLGRQFSALTAMNDISRAVLAELKAERMVDTVLTRFRDTVPAMAMGLVIRSADTFEWLAAVAWNDQRTSRQIVLRPQDLDPFRTSSDHLWFSPAEMGTPFSDLFPALPSSCSVLVLPLREHEDLSGLILLPFALETTVAAEELSHARQLADQVTIALANTHLVERLEHLSLGTLSALARTIDANSPWTAGHSERVTNLSLAIGAEMGLPPRDLDAIHRGGLLHDIGKVAIPPSILDKPGKLTAEEMAVMQSHSAVGARILAPIPVFRDILTIVRHHHEKFDGSGYPDGLAGENIPLLARVVAVADVYDALVSDRPYRSGWKQEDAVDLIRRNAGIHHDPVIVSAFLALADRGVLDTVTTISLPKPADEHLHLTAGAAA